MENKPQTEDKPQTEEKPQDELVLPENLEIEPLTDENLDNVVGGLCSIILCSGNTDTPTVE